MQYIPVKTRRLHPPQDDLFAALEESSLEVRERDVVLISSKVVAIDEGRCVPEADFDKKTHVDNEAELVIDRPYWNAPLTVTNHVFVSSSGVDRSNSDGYYSLLPVDPFASAKRIHSYFKEYFEVKELGVVITDSVSSPCRYGATGCSIGFWGFVPLEDHAGKEDLFGRKMKYERTNLVDGIAAGANVLMGEVAESTPVVVARDIPHLEFTEENLRDKLFCPLEEDTFRVLYGRFLP